MTPEQIREQRETLLSKIETMGTLPNSFRTSVVGVTFAHDYPNNLYRLEEMAVMAMFSDEHIPCVLVRNPLNPFDKYAVEIHVPALGDNGMVGHLTRPVAARLARELDENTIWNAFVANVRVNPENPENPGLDIHLTRKTQAHG
jgi:hypothetical protein